MAAKISGTGEPSIIGRHLLPSFMSYLIVSLTLSIPGMILAETSLSFLGLGIRPPSVSWGALLKDAQNVRTVVQNPWLLVPGLFRGGGCAGLQFPRRRPARRRRPVQAVACRVQAVARKARRGYTRGP